MLAASRSQGRTGFGGSYARRKIEIESDLIRQIVAAKLQPIDQARLEFLWIERNQKRDKDNIAAGRKFILDALVQAGIIPGDGWRHVAGFTDEFGISSECPGIKVVLRRV